ncbi:hypothetical protein Tco_0386899 [Tanacetum coccineum]
MSRTLQQRLVVKNTQMAKEAWDIHAEILSDNKRSRSIDLKPNCPEKYEHVSDIIIHQEPFPNLKTVRLMLTTTEIRLKSRAQVTSIDSSSSSPMVNGPSQNGGAIEQLSVTPVGHETLLPNAFSAMTLQDPASGNWNMDTGASSHLNDSVPSLSNVFNMCIYLSVSVGDGHPIPVTNLGHGILPTLRRPVFLNNVLITPNIVKNLISVRQFVRDNFYTIEFDAFGFSVKDFMTRRLLLRYDNTGDLYPVLNPSYIPHAFLTSQYTWHQRLGPPGSEVLRRVLSSNSISCNK